MENLFGNPDGARSDIDDIIKDFIGFKDYMNGRYSGLLEDFMKTRVIVGSKGSGKTVYLRRMQAELRENHSVYTTDIQQEVPPTELIIRFSQLFAKEALTESWQKLWRIAILSSVVTHLLYGKKWNVALSEDEKDSLKSYEDDLFPKGRVQRTIYTQARYYLNCFSSANAFHEFTDRIDWDDLETIVKEILREAPPIYFFLDAIDEEYAHAPMYWMQCQKGLFYRVMRMVRDNNLGNKLHIVICIRDNVMASVYRSEHHTRYIDSQHIKTLLWDYSAIEYFLEKKINRMPISEFDPDEEKTLENWLDTKYIHNKHRDIDESLEQYILRHTRLLPRDIVIVGNELAKAKLIKEKVPTSDINELIREKVSRCAKTFGDELLQICANQINNNAMPKDAGMKEYTEVYTSVKEYRESTVTVMKEVLHTLKSDKFSWEELVKMNEKANQLISGDANMFDILWQNIGIGYLEDGPNGQREIFFNQENPEFLIPREKDTYILRSCLIDAVGIERTEWDTRPVLGGNPMIYR